MRNWTSMAILTGMMAGVLSLAGCETNAQSGALIGAGGGALLGQAIGRNTTGTLIGAGVGAAGGYIVGNEMDKQQTRSQDVTAPRQSAGYQTGSYQSSSAAGGSTSEKVATTIVIKNSNGSTTPVTLHREGGDWVGPKGEHYDHLPTEAELRPIYGI